MKKNIIDKVELIKKLNLTIDELNQKNTESETKIEQYLYKSRLIESDMKEMQSKHDNLENKIKIQKSKED